jgi:hypothetical protein
MIACLINSDWVDAQFAEIIAVNWPDWPGGTAQRVQVVLAVQADRDDAGQQRRTSGRRAVRARRPGDRGWPRERSPPHAPSRHVLDPSAVAHQQRRDGGVIADQLRTAGIGSFKPVSPRVCPARIAADQLSSAPIGAPGCRQDV